MQHFGHMSVQKWLLGRSPEPPKQPNSSYGPIWQHTRYVVWLGPQHFLDNFFCAHFITFSVFCWVENHPYPKVLGQFLLPHKLFPHPLGYNKLGKSAKECGNTIWWPHSIYTRLSKSAEKVDPRVCYTPNELHNTGISCARYSSIMQFIWGVAHTRIHFFRRFW